MRNLFFSPVADQTSQFPLMQLPAELILHTISYLPLPTKLAFVCTSKQAKQLLQAEIDKTYHHHLKDLKPQGRLEKVVNAEPGYLEPFLCYPAFYKEHLPLASDVVNFMQRGYTYSAGVFGHPPSRILETLEKLGPDQLPLLKFFIQKVIVSDYLPPKCYIDAVWLLDHNVRDSMKASIKIEDWIAFSTMNVHNRMLSHGQTYLAYILIKSLLCNWSIESSESLELRKHIKMQAQFKMNNQNKLGLSGTAKYIYLIIIALVMYPVFKKYDSGNTNQLSP